jgi:hypothetical protein
MCWLFDFYNSLTELLFFKENDILINQIFNNWINRILAKHLNC